jgi:cyanophycinase
MSMVAASPNLLGIGIDENTAAEIRDGRRLTVLGAGSIFVVNARNAITDAPDARRGAPLLVSGAVVHSLPTGSTFDLEHVELTAFVERHPDIEGAVVPAKDRAARANHGSPTVR